jgi:hypothetical protein
MYPVRIYTWILSHVSLDFPQANAREAPYHWPPSLQPKSFHICRAPLSSQIRRGEVTAGTYEVFSSSQLGVSAECAVYCNKHYHQPTREQWIQKASHLCPSSQCNSLSGAPENRATFEPADRLTRTSNECCVTGGQLSVVTTSRRWGEKVQLKLQNGDM